MRSARVGTTTAIALAAAFAACGSDGAERSTERPPIVAPKPPTDDGAVLLPSPSRSAFFPTSDGYEAWGFAAPKKQLPSYKARVDAKTGALSFVLAKKRGQLGLETVAIGRNGARPHERAGVSLSGGVVTIDHGVALETLAPRGSSVEQTFTFEKRPPGAGPLVVRVRASGATLQAERGRIRAGEVTYHDAFWLAADGSRVRLALALERDEIVITVPERVLDKGGFPATLDPTIGPELEVDPPIVDLHGLGTGFPQVGIGKNGTALVVWDDYRVATAGGNSLFSSEHMFGTRVSAAGTVLDPTGIPVVKERDFSFEDWKVVYDGTQNWFVPWFQSGFDSPCDELWGAVVSDQGAVLSTKSTQGACNGNFLDAGFDGTTWVVGFQTTNFYVTRYSAAGEPLDLLPKLIASGTTASPGLGCRTGGCLAAWKSGTEIHATRLGPNLTVVDTTPIVVKTGVTAGERVNGVGFDGTQWIVGFGGTLARVDPTTGNVLGTAVVDATKLMTSFATTATSTWGVWANASGVNAGRMDPSGAALAGWPRTLVTSTTASSAAVAADATQAFVAWADTGRNTFGDVLLTRVSNAGVVLDGAGIALNKTANTERAPAVAASGSGFLVAWSDYRSKTAKDGAYAVRLDTNGAALDGAAVALDPIGDVPAVASDGTDYLAAWYSGQSTFRAARISGATGAVLGPAVDLASNPNTFRPALGAVWDGTQYIVAWMDTSARAARLTRSGALSGSSITLDATAGNGEGISIVAAAGTASTLVVWNSAKEIRGARIDATGQVLDSPFITISPGGTEDKFYPRVAWDGNAWIVVWEDYRAGHIINPDIYVARVGPNGKLLSPPEIAVATSGNAELSPALIGMNDGYTNLVVWSENRDPTRYQDFDLIGAFLRQSDGAILDPGGIVLSNRVGNEVGAALAPAGSGRALLAYTATDYTSGYGTSRIRVRMIGSGAALGATCTSDDQCIMRSCADGVCCDQPCKGVCETCGGTGGKCTPVASTEDTDTCAGDNVCVGAGVCKRKLGRGCTTDADCTSGACSQGLCCERRCDGPCETCAPVTGACTVRTARAAGAPSCAPYACDGKSATCPTSCTSDDACPTGSRCDRSTSVCITGGACIDYRTAAREDQTTVDCAPYACTAAACRTSCRSVADCVSPAVCDEGGHCVPPRPSPAAAGSGCAMAPSDDRPGFALYLMCAGLVLAGVRARNGTRRRA